MKRPFCTFLIFLGLMLALPVAGLAQGGSYPLMSVEKAAKERDETRMSLEGQFLGQHRGEEDEFRFRDTAGREIVVYDREQGREIRLGVPVVIEGEIDRGKRRPEFNLHRVVYGKGEAKQEGIPDAGVSGEDGIFIHLSSGPDEPRHVAMALTLATAFAGEQPVLIYADLDAVGLFTKEPIPIGAEGYRPVDGMIRDLLKAGARIRVCPTCLAAAGFSSADLPQGIGLADKREFLTFATGRILTFDY